MAEEGEACASVHLAFDHLGFGVDSFGAAVVVREGGGGGGLAVQVQAAGEGVYVGQAGGAGSGDPFLQSPGVAGVRGTSQGGEGADQAGRGGHLGAGGGEPGEDLLLAGGEVIGPGEQEPGRAPG